MSVEASLSLVDLDSVDVASLVAEDVHCRTSQSKASHGDSWAPYESKTVSGSK